MIAFATLFLGLVFGPQSVELVVGEEVVAVDIVLDGERVATLREPPWVAQVNLGSEPAPRLLEAIAFDAIFAELGRSRQWINVPREPAELELGLDLGEAGRGATARLTWQSVGGGEPSRLFASFDGLPLEVGPRGAVELPEHDPELLHFVRAEVEFEGGITAGAEAVFGGAFAEDTETALTAIAVEIDSRRTPKPADLARTFRHDDSILSVAAVEKDVADIVVVRTPAASAWCAALGPGSPGAEVRRSFGLPSPSPELEVDRRWQAQLLWPIVRRAGEGDRTYDLFPHSQRLRPENGTLAALLRRVESPALERPSRVADAVAIAGLTAAGGKHRRIVLLIVGNELTADASDLTPEMARRLLGRLGVPLEVWSVGEPTGQTTPWEPSRAIPSSGELERATKALLQRLERQRVVWLRGETPPSRVELVSAGAAVRLAGRLDE